MDLRSDQLAGRQGAPARKSAELKALAAEITTSFEERRAPVFELGDLAGWTQAVNYLISEDYLDVAEHGLRHLRQQFPDSTYANRVGAVLDRLPWEVRRSPSGTILGETFKSSNAMGPRPSFYYSVMAPIDWA